MEGSVQPSQTAGVSNPKPAPGPKPRLAPKPFSLQTNTTIRSIHAPKSIVDASKTATPQGVKSEDATVPKPAVPAPPLKPTTSARAPTKEQGEPTKATEAGQAGRDASDGTSDPVPQATPAVEKPKTAPLESDNAVENNRKTSADAATKLEREDESKKDGTSSTESQVLDESGSDTGNPAHRWGSTRKRLSMEITSRFEQGGGPPPAPSNIGKQATSAKHDIIRAECTNPEQNQTTSELPEGEGEESGPKEDYVGGGSIKRRISLLFDSRPEVTVKREEPEMINGTGGVKARIKNWAMDTVPEKKPQFVPRPRSKSTETSTPAEKTPETPPTEPPTSSSQVADLPSTSLPVHQPTEGEVSGKHKETEATEDGQSLIFSQAAGHTDETDSANNALKRDNSKRRSVHFGVVEKDDGGPPVILGPESDSSEEEEEEEEEGQEKEDAEADVPVSVPVYRRVGLLQNDGSAEAEEAEKLHHLEFEKKRRAEETEEARRTIEEHKRKEEEEGKEREKERQLEIERVRIEKRQRLEREQERVRLEEEEREKERLKEEEIERKRMRLEEEEREKERLRQEQLEKQRIALERMRLEEEEKERLRKEEMERERKELERRRLEEEEKERLRLEEMEKKRMALERMRLEEEEKERLRQEEMEKKRMELERMRLEEEEKERLRQEEMQKKRMELERMRLEEEEKERLRQEEMEKKRMELERMRLEQEKKERLRLEEMEKKRMELERRLEEEEREKEKLRKEMERQRVELERRLEEEEREKEKLRKEMERQRMELERRLEEEENEKERMRREMERQMELDTIRMEEEERQKERLKENEMERHREEWERARWEEEHREKENIKEEEIERERRIHQLWHRQKEEIEMMETEDITQEERESKRLWLERERQRLRKEEEERVIHESDEHKSESKLREEEINKEKQREEEWENHWVSKVERLKEENEEKNDPSLMWQSRKEEERDKYTRWKEEQEVERGQKEKEDILICFDSGGVPAKSSESHRSPTQEDVEVVYEDFSIKKNLLEVEFDDFSVKPVKSGGGARDEISAVVQDGGQGAAADAPSEEDEEVDVSMFKWEYKAKQQVESADTREPAASQEREEEEEQLIFSTEITSPSTTQEEPKQEEDAHEVKDDPREERVRSHGDPGASETTRVSFWTMQYLGGKLSAAQLQVAGWVGNVRRSLQGALDLVWGSAEDKQEEEQDEGVDGGGRFQRAVSPLRNFARRSRRSLRRLSTRSRTTVHRKAGETRSAEDNSCTNVKEKGAEVLIDGVPDEQNEAPDQPSETDSPDPESDHHLETSSEDLDTTDFRSETDVAPFPESSTPLLDSSAQKSKADLSKRISRTRPSRSLRAGLSQGESPDWRISDSSVLSSKQRESDSEDEQPKQKIFSPHPTSQRVPIFPGLSPAALIAQIKRKTGGKVEETLDDNGREEKEAGAAPSPSQLSSSPRTAAHLTGAARVLPPLPGTDERATACPPWLKELKSKKRLSQYDGEP